MIVRRENDSKIYEQFISGKDCDIIHIQNVNTWMFSSQTKADNYVYKIHKYGKYDI